MQHRKDTESMHAFQVKVQSDLTYPLSRCQSSVTAKIQQRVGIRRLLYGATRVLISIVGVNGHAHHPNESQTAKTMQDKLGLSLGPSIDQPARAAVVIQNT